jgi:hypothetical protein
MVDNSILTTSMGLLLLRADTDMALWKRFTEGVDDNELCQSGECADSPQDCQVSKSATGCYTCILNGWECSYREDYYRWVLRGKGAGGGEDVDDFLAGFLALRNDTQKTLEIVNGTQGVKVDFSILRLAHSDCGGRGGNNFQHLRRAAVSKSISG